MPALLSTVAGFVVTFMPTLLTAQSCTDVDVHLPDNGFQSRRQVAESLATSLKMSVLVELAYSPEERPMLIPQDKATLEDFAMRMRSGGDVHCAIEKNVIHIYDSETLSSNNNALNHVFSGFQIPQVADLFAIEFRTRLLHEAFLPEGAAPYSGSTSGATGNDADRYKLIPELLLNVSARSVLLRAASETPMVFAEEIRTEPSQDLQKNWEAVNKQLTFKVLR